MSEEHKRTVIEKLLYDMVLKEQGKFLAMVPEEKRKQGYGRAATVIIDGPQGGVFDLWFTEQGIMPKPIEVPVKNRVWMTESTFWECVTPDLSKLERRDVKGNVIATGMEVLVGVMEKDGIEYVLKNLVPQLGPRLDFRNALSKQLITMDGDTSIYDSEEWAQAIEKLILGKIFPIIVRAMAQAEKK